MKRFILLLFVFTNVCCYAQSDSTDAFDTWDANYPERSYKEIVQKEEVYARNVEADTNEIQYFCRFAKYKISGIYQGKRRTIHPDVLESMQRVFKINIGVWPWRGKMEEVLFSIEGENVWLAIQPILTPDLKKEVKKGDSVILYCAFFNEHLTSGTLQNTLFISEFRRQ